MPLFTNLVGDTWQPEAVENLAHSSTERQDRFIQKVLAILNDAKAAGVVIDWEQLDPAYKKDITAFLDRFTDALHYDDKQLWLCVQPGQDLDYIDFEELSDNVDRFVAMLFDETSDIDPPGPLGSRRWFEGWLNVLMDGAETNQWIIALGSYGYDWTGGGKKAELISFPEAMSRASYAGVDKAVIEPPHYNPYFYYEDADKEFSLVPRCGHVPEPGAASARGEGRWLRGIYRLEQRRGDLGRARFRTISKWMRQRAPRSKCSRERTRSRTSAKVKLFPSMKRRRTVSGRWPWTRKVISPRPI